MQGKSRPANAPSALAQAIHAHLREIGFPAKDPVHFFGKSVISLMCGGRRMAITVEVDDGP